MKLSVATSALFAVSAHVYVLTGEPGQAVV